MDFEKISHTLSQKGYDVSTFATAAEASDYLNCQIDGATVAFGGSVTLQQMNLYETLGQHNQVLWHWHTPEGQTPPDVLRAAMSSDIYLTSVNGLAETGELINIDGSGNRVSAMFYGHKKLYFIVGVNKIAPTYEAALWRARNIAAPLNAQRLSRKTPCAIRGDKCFDCDSPQRICKGLAVLWQKMGSCEMEVVLINEKLGY